MQRYSQLSPEQFSKTIICATLSLRPRCEKLITLLSLHFSFAAFLKTHQVLAYFIRTGSIQNEALLSPENCASICLVTTALGKVEVVAEKAFILEVSHRCEKQQDHLSYPSSPKHSTKSSSLSTSCSDSMSGRRCSKSLPICAILLLKRRKFRWTVLYSSRACSYACNKSKLSRLE